MDFDKILFMHWYIWSMLWLIHIIFPNFSTELWPLTDFRIMFMLNILWNNWRIWSNLVDTLVFFYAKTCATTKISTVVGYHVVLATLLYWNIAEWVLKYCWMGFEILLNGFWNIAVWVWKYCWTPLLVLKYCWMSLKYCCVGLEILLNSSMGFEILLNEFEILLCGFGNIAELLNGFWNIAVWVLQF